MLQETLQKARAARGQLAQMTDGARSALLLAAAHELTAATEELLAANAEDLARMDPSNPLYDRLLLTRPFGADPSERPPDPSGQRPLRRGRRHL